MSPGCCSTRKHEHYQVLPSCQKMQNFAQHRLAQNTLGKQKVKVSLDWDYFGLRTDLPSVSDVRVHLALIIVAIVLIFLMNLFLQCWRGCIKHGQKINVKNTELRCLCCHTAFVSISCLVLGKRYLLGSVSMIWGAEALPNAKDAQHTESQSFLRI